MPAHLLTAHSGVTGLLLAAAAKKSSGSPIFLYLIVVMLGVYLLWLRPQKKRQQAAAQAQRQAEVGDEVVTAAGIYGTVVAFDGDRVTVEIAPGMTIEVARRALGQRVDPEPIADEADEAQDTGTGFGHPGYDGHDDLDDPPPSDGPAAGGPAPGGKAKGGTGAAPEPHDFSAGWHETPPESGSEGEEQAPGGPA